MIFEEYLEQIETNVSQVKLLILKTLWQSGSSFPRDWVASSFLLQITQQKYFDRRTRELRDESGCDIETRHIDGKHQYRLASPVLKTSNPRLYLTALEKKRLFEREKNTCQICGKNTKSGIRGLQADHKIPLIRGGGHEAENWQSICSECNVAKRRACQGCQIDCLVCQWAFPEENGMPITIYVPPSEFDLIQTELRSNPNWLRDLISDTIKSE